MRSVKTPNLHWLVIAVFFAAACKKDDQHIVSEIKNQADLEVLRDSVSYSVGLKTVNSRMGINRLSSAYLQPNSKIDSVVNYNYYISGDKDSVMFVKTFVLHDENFKHSLSVSFAKKYKKILIPGYVLPMIPEDLFDVYKVGPHPYAVDVFKENTQNGISIEISGDNERLKTSGADTFGRPSTITKDAQKDSKFEIISFGYSRSGQHVLEARFSATMFDKDEKPQKVDNGYLKLFLN